MRPTEASINLSALVRNARKLRVMAGKDNFFCPMVKANAYGHGAVDVTNALIADGVEYVGVSLIEEGVELRKAGIKTNILVFGAFNDLNSAKAIAEYSLTPVISSNSQLTALEQSCASEKLNLHFKFDTGMNRLGFAVDQAPRLRLKLAKFSNWTIEGICTHLLKGEDGKAKGGFSATQLEKFQKASEAFEGLQIFKHALNTSGLNALTQANLKIGSRPGIALYGGSDGFESVMTLKSKVVTIREVESGESVSYNASWVAKRKSKIGIVPIGYADGIPRNLTNKFGVLVCETTVPVVGTVCMDYVMLDLTDVQDQLVSLGEGTEVVFLGRQGRAEIRALEWAKILDTISYEIFTRISSRVPRNYVST